MFRGSGGGWSIIPGDNPAGKFSINVFSSNELFQISHNRVTENACLMHAFFRIYAVIRGQGDSVFWWE